MSVGFLSQKKPNKPYHLKMKVLATIAVEWSIYWFTYCVLIAISAHTYNLSTSLSCLLPLDVMKFQHIFLERWEAENRVSGEGIRMPEAAG